MSYRIDLATLYFFKEEIKSEIHWSGYSQRCEISTDKNIWDTFLGVIRYSVIALPEVTYLLTYLLTQCCRVLLEKLTGLQLIEKFPAFHGTRRFITALTSVRHLSLSWANPIQSIYLHPTSSRSILILSTHLRLGFPSGFFPSGFPSMTLYTPLSSPIRATCPVHQGGAYRLEIFTLSRKDWLASAEWLGPGLKGLIGTADK